MSGVEMRRIQLIQMSWSQNVEQKIGSSLCWVKHFQLVIIKPSVWCLVNTMKVNVSF